MKEEAAGASHNTFVSLHKETEVYSLATTALRNSVPQGAVMAGIYMPFKSLQSFIENRLICMSNQYFSTSNTDTTSGTGGSLVVLMGPTVQQDKNMIQQWEVYALKNSLYPPLTEVCWVASGPPTRSNW